MNQTQRDNFRQAIALVTAMDADREDVTMFVDVVMGYIAEPAAGTVSASDAIDLISGLSMLSTALLALRENETGTNREDTLRDLALRLEP